MKSNGKSLVLAGILAVGCLGLGSTPARAQGFSFGLSTPGLSVGVGQGPYGYSGGVFAGYPAVVGGPVVAGPVVAAPVVPYVVRRPFYGPRVYAPPIVYGPRAYPAAVRPGPYYYGRRW
jgi:hypothetical protein